MIVTLNSLHLTASAIHIAPSQPQIKGTQSKGITQAPRIIQTRRAQRPTVNLEDLPSRNRSDELVSDDESDHWDSQVLVRATVVLK